MNIKVNGEPLAIAADATIELLLTQLELTGKRLAVEVNEEIVPRSNYQQHQLHDGDQIEIVHAIGGG